MLVSEQDRIIGPHGNLKSALKDWMRCADLPKSKGKIIRHLDEEPLHRNALLDECAMWLVLRIVGEPTLKYLQNEKKTLSPVEYKETVEAAKYLPIDDKTRKGDLGEILLSKYLEEVTGFTSFGIYRLVYGTNIDKSMFGDDVLLFHPSNINDSVIYGESKVRGEPSNQVIDEIVNNLQGMRKFPVSITFITKRLIERGDCDLAQEINKMQVQMAQNKVPVRNIGFLMSKRDAEHAGQDTLSKVVSHLNYTNPNLAFIALGIDDVQQFVDEAYQRANNILFSGRP